jgi:DNA-binding MarR family transcriptional regulator
MIHIFSTSKELKEATNYAQIARGKASKLKRQRMQAKKNAIEQSIISSIDNEASYMELKRRRQNAADKRAKIAAKRLTAAQKAKIA